MKILFAGSNNCPNGGALDIVATDVRVKDLNELLDANSALGYHWWHLYDTVERDIIKSGTFPIPSIKVTID